MADHEELGSNAVKEEPMDQAATVASLGQQQQQQLVMDDVQMSSVEEGDDEAQSCTTDNDVLIKNSLSKCVLCSKSFVTEDNPKLLECLHAACVGCVNLKLQTQPSCQSDSNYSTESNVINCKVCNVVSHLDNLIENRFFSKFLEDDVNLNVEEESKDEDEKKCTNCSENAVATSWCIECEEWICQNCVMAHQRLKITKDHTIKLKEEMANHTENEKKKEKKQSCKLFCTVHTNELLSLFCQTCDRLTCRDCQLSDHRDHKYKFIHEIAAETKTSVQQLLSEVSYKRELLKSAMKVIEDRQMLITDKKKTIINEIRHMVVQLNNAISSRSTQLITRMNEVCDQKQNTLNEKKIALDQLSKLTDHCVDFVNYALRKGTDMELLYSKKSVTNHLQRIKSKRADIPNPEIPVRIHLNVDKLQDLIQVITSIGAIVVDGRVYPSVTPPLESGTSSTPTSESTEQRPISGTSSMEQNVTMENTPSSQAHIVPFSTSQASNMPVNAYVAQPMNIPSISPHQQIIQPQHLAGGQQIQPQNYIHYNTVNMQQHIVPSNQRMPMFNYNGRMQQQQQPQQMMPQRPGLGNCHQQVTSSTHPHHQKQQQQQQLHVAGSDPIINQNPNLRGLLAHNPPAYRPTVNNATPYRYPPRYRYPMNNNQRPVGPPQSYQSPPGTSLLNNMQMRQQPQTSQQSMHIYQQQQQQMQSARWHIPQNINSGAATAMFQYQSKNPLVQAPGTSINEAYKITLKNQSSNPSAPQTNTTSTASPPVNSDSIAVSQNPGAVSHTVSSSMPKTPSPASDEKTDETQKSLDKFCQKSLNDLMQTIAKLDRTGIMVIPETQKNQLDSAQVDSSTDGGANAVNETSSVTAMGKEDPNEDWCAVCMDGGDAVLCCDKCPKVFHLYCHIPTLKSFPDESETWQCMLCTNVLENIENSETDSNKRPHQMSARDLRIAQRIVLELYCQYEQSLPFREVVSPEILEYHKVIKKPIALDVIKEKLKPENENQYTDLKQVMADIRLMFKNAFTFNSVDSQVYQEARSLEEYFEKLLLKWAPSYAFDDPLVTPEEDEEVFPLNRKYRRIISE